MRTALLGCGFIGKTIAKTIASKKLGLDLVAVFDLEKKNSEEVADLFDKKPLVAKSVEEVLEQKPELVVEAASQEAVRQYAEKVLEKSSLLIMSTGALGDERLEQRLREKARESGKKIYLPSGAIGGLDAVKSASEAEIYSVELTTTKNPKSLGLDLDEKKVLFEGNAKEAAEKFPKNINVSVTLSLAGIGVEKTLVRIVADPSVETNTHEIRIRGDFGEFYSRAENVPSPENPKTSYLAALSAIRTLRNVCEELKTGT